MSLGQSRLPNHVGCRTDLVRQASRLGHPAAVWPAKARPIIRGMEGPGNEQHYEQACNQDNSLQNRRRPQDTLPSPPVHVDLTEKDRTIRLTCISRPAQTSNESTTPLPRRPPTAGVEEPDAVDGLTNWSWPEPFQRGA